MFDLEKAVVEWKRSLQRSPVFEDGHIAELEANLRDEVEELIGGGQSPEDAFAEALTTVGRPNRLGVEYSKAHSRRRFGRPSFEPPRFVPGLAWNYAKVALRKMRRQKGFAFLNIAGLTVGLAAALFILLFVRFELGFDRYHKDLDRIFLVGLSSSTATGKSLSGSNMPLMGPTIQAQFPQIESAARFTDTGGAQVAIGTRAFREEGLLLADQAIFDILDLPFLQGDSSRALDRPQTVVLSRTLARKYFGTDDPLGRVIAIADKDYEITGVVADARPDSDFRFNLIRSWKSVEKEEHYQVWSPGMRIAMTLIKLAPGADPAAVEGLIRKVPEAYCREELKAMGATAENFLLPLSRFHRVALGGAELRASPAMIFVRIFAAVGLLVLLIACLNFVNLATARSAGRAVEVGLRKVVGAGRKQLLAAVSGRIVPDRVPEPCGGVRPCRHRLAGFEHPGPDLVPGRGSFSPDHPGRCRRLSRPGRPRGRKLPGLRPVVVPARQRPQGSAQNRSAGRGDEKSPCRRAILHLHRPHRRHLDHPGPDPLHEGAAPRLRPKPEAGLPSQELGPHGDIL